jgi:S-formylglutathione hydrolase FrmB
VQRLGLTLGLLLTLAARSAQGNADFPDCAEPSATAVVVGAVACQLIDSGSVGGVIPFSYYVPPRCDPALDPKPSCPVLYLLHGFGGSYQSLLQSPNQAYVRALTAGPPVDPTQVLDPWSYASTSTWEPKPPLDLILVAPHGRTVPGGLGPGPGLDSFWADWNPRYAAGGDTPKYATEPPRFESYLVNELIPFVEGHFPTGRGRDWHALDGESLGGYGSYKNGLQHPDVWASIGSISGALNFLFTPGLDPTNVTSPVGVSPPAGLPYTPLPAPISSALPFDDLPEAAQGFAVALLVLGDPSADQAYFRGHMPRDLAMNGRAFTGVSQTLHVRGMVNDTIPRRSEDLTSFSPTSVLFEDIVLPMNLEMEVAFLDEGVHQDFEIHPGLHSRPYRDPYLRHQLEEHYAVLQHSDGQGAPKGPPDVFDYRSIRNDFTVWGWSFHVEREPIECLNLRAVSCSGITIQGTGVVTVTVPASCGTGVSGSATFPVDLGGAFPIDEPGGASALPVYGKTVTVALSLLP